MKTRSWAFVLLVGVLGLATVPARAACDPAGGAEFICGVTNAEDLVRVPDTQWVLVSGMSDTGQGHLYAIDRKAKTPVSIYPGEGAKEQLDRKTYAACPVRCRRARSARTASTFIRKVPGSTRCTL